LTDILWLFGGVAAILDSTMVTIALHTLVVSLHSTDGAIGWVTTGYLLAMAVAIPVTGWAEARWGGRRVWMAALLLFVAGSVLCAVAWNDASLIGFRVVQGFARFAVAQVVERLGARVVTIASLDHGGGAHPRARPASRPRGGTRLREYGGGQDRG
jgi:MFS family permease